VKFYVAFMENAKLIETKGARLIGLHAIQAVMTRRPKSTKYT